MPLDDEIEDAEIIEGAPDAVKSVTDFLRKQLASVEVEGSLPIELCITGQGSSDPIDRWTYRLDVELTEFVEDLVAAAVGDMEHAHYKGRIKYAIRAKVGGTWRRVVFTLIAPRTAEDEKREFGGDIPELPSVRGLIAGNQRHTEVAYNQLIKMAAIGHDAKDNIIKRQEFQIRDLTVENRQLRSERDDVRNLKWIRDIEERTLLAEQERKDKAVQMLMAGGSIIVSKMLGGPTPDPGQLLGGIMNPGGNGAAAQDAGNAPAPSGMGSAIDGINLRQNLILDNLFDMLTAEKIQTIATVLSPTEMALLGELHRCRLDRQEATQPKAGANGAAKTNGASA